MLPEIDIVLPCYNPPAGWQQAIRDFHQFISQKYKVTFLIVDDGSTSEHISEAIGRFEAGFPITLISLPVNRGKGFALREGVRATAADLVLYTDIDLPFTHESMETVMRKATSGTCDIVAGHRDQAYYNGTMTPFRRHLSRSFRFFMKYVLRLSLYDTQCGLKAFNGKGKTLFLATGIDRYLFDFEFIYAAVNNSNVRLCSEGVTLKQNVVFSKMRWNVLLRESVNLFAVLGRSTIRSVFRRPSQRG